VPKRKAKSKIPNQHVLKRLLYEDNDEIEKLEDQVKLIEEETKKSEASFERLNSKFFSTNQSI